MEEVTKSYDLVCEIVSRVGPYDRAHCSKVSTLWRKCCKGAKALRTYVVWPEYNFLCMLDINTGHRQRYEFMSHLRYEVLASCEGLVLISIVTEVQRKKGYRECTSRLIIGEPCEKEWKELPTVDFRVEAAALVPGADGKVSVVISKESYQYYPGDQGQKYRIYYQYNIQDNCWVQETGLSRYFDQVTSYSHNKGCFFCCISGPLNSGKLNREEVEKFLGLSLDLEGRNLLCCILTNKLVLYEYFLQMDAMKVVKEINTQGMSLEPMGLVRGELVWFYDRTRHAAVKLSLNNMSISGSCLEGKLHTASCYIPDGGRAIYDFKKMTTPKDLYLARLLEDIGQDIGRNKRPRTEVL